jgi:hypothetical protein
MEEFHGVSFGRQKQHAFYAPFGTWKPNPNISTQIETMREFVQRGFALKLPSARTHTIEHWICVGCDREEWVMLRQDGARASVTCFSTEQLLQQKNIECLFVVQVK